MNKKKSMLERLSKYLFWDVDPTHLDVDKSKPYIIQRVLEYGQLEDWQAIRQYYGIDTIAEVCKQLRSLDPRAVTFVALLSNTNLEDYRCYRFSQSNPTPWNS